MNYGQIHDMLNQNVAHKLSKKEIQDYNRPVHYSIHHGVLKPSAPYQIVSSLSTTSQRQLINDYWDKRPDLINKILGVLLQFRENPSAVSGFTNVLYNQNSRRQKQSPEVFCKRRCS